MRDVWCPDTIEGDPSSGNWDVLMCGMIHKMNMSSCYRLAALFDATGGSYTVSLSAVAHENQPPIWQSPQFAALRHLFGSHFKFLGTLADDGLVRAMQQADVVALLYDPAVRANNTLFWTARRWAHRIITNIDRDSPAEANEVGIFDLASLKAWPNTIWRMPHEDIDRGWDALVRRLNQPTEVTA